MNKKYLIIYHKEDNDGVFSGAIFKDYLMYELNIAEADIDTLPADYNILADFSKAYSDMEKLKEEYTHIIMTDLSFNDWRYMKKLYNAYESNLVWVDHHAPIIQCSIDNNFDDIPGLRDTSRSAILNAWKYLYDPFDEAYKQKKVPELLRILSAWDSWSYEREGYDFGYVKDVNKGVTDKYDLDLKKACKLIEIIKVYYRDESNLTKDNNIILEMYNHGHALNEYEDKKMTDIVKNSGDMTWQIWDYDKEDSAHPIIHKACAIFHQGATNSTMFKCLEGSVIRHGLVFKHQPNGNWVLSMYNVENKDPFHCGEFLRNKYNGGGHAGAAGCTFTLEQFIKILKNKRL